MVCPQYGMVRYGMVWYGMVWYGMVWYGKGLYGTVRYSVLIIIQNRGMCGMIYVHGTNTI
jgi:hypothetical protein